MKNVYNYDGIWNMTSGRSSSSGVLWDRPTTLYDRAERTDVAEPVLYADSEGDAMVWREAADLSPESQRRHGRGPIITAERLARLEQRYTVRGPDGSIVVVRICRVSPTTVGVELDGAVRVYAPAEMVPTDASVEPVWSALRARAREILRA